VGSPIKFSDFEPEIVGAPLLGEHTDHVLSELGYDEKQIADLHAKGVVRTEELPAEGHRLAA
jgi:formyl-CoA transferase